MARNKTTILAVDSNLVGREVKPVPERLGDWPFATLGGTDGRTIIANDEFAEIVAVYADLDRGGRPGIVLRGKTTNALKEPFSLNCVLVVPEEIR